MAKWSSSEMSFLMLKLIITQTVPSDMNRGQIFPQPLQLWCCTQGKIISCVNITSAAGGRNKRQEMLAVHRTSQSQEGAYAEGHSPVTVAAGLCPGSSTGTVLGSQPGEGCLLRAE